MAGSGRWIEAQLFPNPFEKGGGELWMNCQLRGRPLGGEYNNRVLHPPEGLGPKTSGPSPDVFDLSKGCFDRTACGGQPDGDGIVGVPDYGTVGAGFERDEGIGPGSPSTRRRTPQPAVNRNLLAPQERNSQEITLATISPERRLQLHEEPFRSRGLHDSTEAGSTDRCFATDANGPRPRSRGPLVRI